MVFLFASFFFVFVLIVQSGKGVVFAGEIYFINVPFEPLKVNIGPNTEWAIQYRTFPCINRKETRRDTKKKL